MELNKNQIQSVLRFSNIFYNSTVNWHTGGLLRWHLMNGLTVKVAYLSGFNTDFPRDEKGVRVIKIKQTYGALGEAFALLFQSLSPPVSLTR